MKRFFIRGSFILIAGFAILFCLRLGYGYLMFPSGIAVNTSNNWTYSNFTANTEQSEKKNYATNKIGSGSAPDQKYEKIGAIVSRSENFTDDEAKLRSLIVQYKALIQSEQRSGLPGNQNLQLGIGVIPDKFDEMVRDCRAIGKTLSLQINKSDKTNEYNDLQAKRTSLTQTRAALASLKNRSGKIDELMDLENRILEIDGQIQGLGVRLGEFDEENEFCTVKLTLTEGGKVSGIPLSQRLIVALEWTVPVYAGFLAMAFFGALFLLILFRLVPRIRTLSRDWKIFA